VESRHAFWERLVPLKNLPSVPFQRSAVELINGSRSSARPIPLIYGRGGVESRHAAQLAQGREEHIALWKMRLWHRKRSGSSSRSSARPASSSFTLRGYELPAVGCGEGTGVLRGTRSRGGGSRPAGKPQPAQGSKGRAPRPQADRRWAGSLVRFADPQRRFFCVRPDTGLPVNSRGSATNPRGLSRASHLFSTAS